MVDKQELEYCEVCNDAGWIWDDVAYAAGSTPHKYCYCEHGDLLAEEDAATKRKDKKQFKTCPTCNGAGKVKRGE